MITSIIGAVNRVTCVCLVAVLSVDGLAKNSHKSAYELANEYSKTGEGVGIIIRIGKVDMALFKERGILPDLVGQKLEEVLTEYSVISKSFWELGNGDYTGVAFDLGPLTYKDDISGKSVFSISGAIAASPRVAQKFKNLQKFNNKY